MKNADLLRQVLLGIQAHAAGLHASADMALRLLGEMRQEAPKPKGPMYNGRPAVHYGEEEEPEAAIEQLFESIEDSAGIARNPAYGGDTPSGKE